MVMKDGNEGWSDLCMEVITKFKLPEKYKLIQNTSEQKQFSWWAYWWEGFKFKFTWRF